MISKTELAEIKERESKATKGRWQRGYADGSGSEMILADKPIAVTNWGCSCCQDETTEQNEIDAEFIARSKQDIPLLIEALESAIEVIRFYSTIKQHDEYDDALNEKAREFLKQWEGDK